MRDGMERHLAVLKSKGHIADWYDRRVVPGQEFQEVIDQRFDSADIILLLISANFFQSQACIREMKRALELKEASGTTVLPVIVRPCDWKSSDISHLLALPTDGVPITNWSNRDNAFVDVAKGIRKVVETQVSGINVRADFRSSISTIEFVVAQQRRRYDR